VVPRPPPPDWTVESEAQEGERAVLPDWQTGRAQLPNPWEVDTACRTRVAPRVARGSLGLREVAPLRVVLAGTARGLPVPVVPEAAPSVSRNPARRRVALGCFVALLSLCSLGLALWQLYWMLEGTDTGRAILDRMTSALSYVTGLF
jgi:hypothetical protein